jgi:hypothetical protein
MTSTVVNSKTCEISEPGASLLSFLQSDLGRAHPVDGEGWQRAVSSETGNPKAALAAAATQVRATHTTAYLAHVPL